MSIAQSDLSRLRPAQRAELIYTSARTRTDEALWRSLMAADLPVPNPPRSPQGMDRLGGIDALLQSLAAGAPPEGQEPPEGFRSAAAGEVSVIASLGPNQPHLLALQAAALRTGLPPAALAAIVDAESAKTADGRWNVMSRNPRSSAAGIGQFLSGTWIAEAERSGTWLHGTASHNGWLDRHGKVRPNARAELLGLRYQPDAAIETVADYAKANLTRFAKAGLAIAPDQASVARAAYLGHHLGPGDALRFLRGGLPPERAERLLAAQVGAGGAVRRIAAAGDAAAAHRRWLAGFIEQRVRVDRFTA